MYYQSGEFCRLGVWWWLVWFDFGWNALSTSSDTAHTCPENETCEEEENICFVWFTSEVY